VVFFSSFCLVLFTACLACILLLWSVTAAGLGIDPEKYCHVAIPFLSDLTTLGIFYLFQAFRPTTAGCTCMQLQSTTPAPPQLQLHHTLPDYTSSLPDLTVRGYMMKTITFGEVGCIRKHFQIKLRKDIARKAQTGRITAIYPEERC
jgi:hypothetical protein